MIEMEGLQDDEIKLTLAKMLPKGHPDMGDMPILFFNIRLLDGTRIGQCDLRVGDSRHTEVLGISATVFTRLIAAITMRQKPVV